MNLMETINSILHGLLSGTGPFLILLGILIFVHELGHFLVAKLYGVRVEVFSLGFGKKILQFKKGDTLYCVSLIPLGGYVKMFGDDPSKEIAESEKKYSFLHQPVFPRIAIVLAGPLMNLFFTFFLFIIIGLMGEPMPGPYVGDVPTSSRAYEAGFRSGDRVLSINNQPVQTWVDIKDKVAQSANEKLHFEVERENSLERGQISVTPVFGENDNILSRKSQIGVIDGLEAYSLGTMVSVIDPQSAAAQAGLKSLDVILAVNDREVSSWRTLHQFLKEDIFKNRVPIKLKVQSYVDKDQGSEPHDVILSSFQPKMIELSKEHQKLHDQIPAIMELSQIGIENAQLSLWKVKKNSPADRAGLRSGDRLVSIDGQAISDWNQVLETVKRYNPDSKPLKFQYKRNGQIFEADLTPEMTELMDPTKGKEEKRFTVGIVSGLMQSSPQPVFIKSQGLGSLLSLGLHRTWETTTMVVMSLVRLIQGDVSAKNIGGIISIGRFANQSYQAGTIAFLKMMALISINLFLLNLLPVPVLDGGHLLFFSIEALRGVPVSMRKMEIAQQIGLVLLMSLMAFALFNDISNWLNSSW